MNLNIFSKSTKHAIQAMIYLASNKDKPVLVVTIADYYSIPIFYLSKIIQTLRKHNLVSSVRGRGGGISLKRKPKTIHVSDIVNAIEGKDDEKQMCAYGIDICSDFVPCPIHDDWKKIKSQIQDRLIHQNLETLTNELIKKHALLKNKKRKSKN